MAVSRSCCLSSVESDYNRRQESIDGLDDLVDGLEENIGVDVGVLAVVRLGYKNTRHQREVLGGLRDQGFSVPVVIGERGSLIEGCWKQQCSSCTYIKECSAWKREMSWTRLISSTNSPITKKQEVGLLVAEVLLDSS